MLVAMVVGIVLGIFVRGRRRRGWKVAGWSLLAFFVSLAAANYTLDKNTTKQAAVAATPSAPESAAKQVAFASPATEAPTQVAERFGAAALTAYCDGYQKTLSVIREADDKFGIEGTDAKMDWINERDEAIGKETEKAIGEPYTEWQPVAQQQNWDQRCQGMERGWLLIEDADLLAARDTDAIVVARALKVAYQDRIDEGTDLPFSRYSAAGCNWKEQKGYRFVACTLTGGRNGFRSDPFLFYVGQKDGASVIVPLDNDHMDKSSYRDTDAGETVVPMGWYVGPLPFRAIPFVELRALFE